MELQFLWGGPEPRPSPELFAARSKRWWEQYASATGLDHGRLSELHRTSSDIAALLPDPTNWSGAPTPFRGLVVGAVQSGKTSSMIGVTAIALDQGYRMVVVLAGGKDDLRQQTARRFNTQLVRQRDEIEGVPGAFTIARGVKDRPNGGIALPYSVDIHRWAPGFVRIRDHLERSEPCVFVIKKNTASLATMRLLLGRAYDEFGAANLPTLVLDDECDDASVDRLEAPIPEAIANLWRTPAAPLTAYVGYTATAAANLLQQPNNELYPEHFVYLLRYADSEETALTVREPNPDSWYSGSYCFYEAFGESPGPSSNFLVAASVTATDLVGPVESNSSLRDAVRAYLVAGAYRLALEPEASFSVSSRAPRSHSMLIQTSALMDEHDRTLSGLARMFGGMRHEDGTVTLGERSVSADIVENESDWERWYQEFSETRERLYLERPSPRPFRHASWQTVRSLLAEVVRNVRAKAVNSDPAVGQELDYAPRLMSDGTVLPPRDIYVIAVGGSKLSRGITVEGLCVTYFTRWTPNPTEDTVLQLSRWFGYRGEHLEFCRLFTTLEIYEALTEIHENDADLRYQLASLMERRETPRNAGLILKSNPRALPTAKVGAGRIFDLQFSPYQTVFRTVEIGDLAQSNELAAVMFVENVRARSPEPVHTVTGGTRGVVSRGWTVLEVAGVLDSISLSQHNPSLAGNPGGAFHRPPDATRAICSTLPYRSDPYQVAAYLREWAAMAVAGKAAPPPLFDVGFAHGQRGGGTEPFDFPLLNRVITREGKLVGEWTGRSAAWHGDALFDEPDARLLIVGSSLRGNGLRGLLLLYVIHRNAIGRQGEGIVRRTHSVTFGISIPDGGPKLRRVTVTPS